ncbi:NACHT, LRR and PYD domains-containing protein 12-like [Dendronephthya gigantea]|uniref:NACHT, LRR and PYD domains-containing protein 12-like n=1 Tax=Dendronephthya gigantea TaxID=151771 RepID=UPI00106CE39B|nr:NACHT, LRR and PYD domains-containing protein 12-like [Dendronephthya gigantea]
MEGCLKLLPRNCYNTYSSVALALFVAIGVVLVGIASDYESRSSLECDPNKSFTSTLSKRKYVETQCLLKYGHEFLPSLSLNVLIVISFGLVVILSVVYGFLVKHRVDIFSNNPNTMASVGVEECQPLSRESPAAPVAYRGSYFVFMAYMIHLIVCRIIPLTIFSAFLLTSSNFPTHFECRLPHMKTTGTFHENITQATTNSSSVDCTYSMGGKKEQVAVGFITINFLADAVTLMEIVYLLWSALKRPTFHTDQEFISVYLLRKRTETILEINQELRQIIREEQSQNLFYVRDDFGGEYLSRRELDDIYINVVIQDGREPVDYFRRAFMKCRHEIYDIQLEKPPDAKVLQSTVELFQAAKAGEEPPRTVLVVGRPGIGKTLLTKKIFNQSHQDETSLFWYEKILVLIQFRSLSKGETSLQEILSQAYGLDMSSPHCDMTIYEYICKNPSNVILIFDGLDEHEFDEECLTDEKIVNSPEEMCHIFLIVKHLVNGKLLPGATVLITSRPTAEHVYKNLDFTRKVEILGFSEKQIEEYVGKFCGDDTQRSFEIWSIIKDSPELLSFCYIPVNSYIVCLTFNESIGFGGQVNGERYSNIPKTMTELYKRAIRILLFKHNSKYRNKQVPRDYLTAKLPKPLQEDLDKLKKIAKDGMEKDQLLFQFESSDKSMAGLSDSGLFNQLEDKRRSIFAFLHLTIQEFLAALYVVDDIRNVESFLWEHINKPRWHLVIQFVAGLLGDRMRELRSSENKEWEIFDFICQRFQDWMPYKRCIDKSNDKALLVIKSVWEMQEDHVMEMISSFASEDDNETFTLLQLNIAPAESTALFKFLSHIKNLKNLEIFGCDWMKINTVRELAEFLKNNHGLGSANCELIGLNVNDNIGLTGEGAKYSSHALKSDNCSKLTKLDVTANELIPEFAKYLSDALKSDNCQLTKLYLSHNDLKSEFVEYLGDALKSDNCKLTELDISKNRLSDEGAKYLSDALKSDNCKLTELDISQNHLTAEGVEYLSDALKSFNCKLTKLNVSDNKLPPGFAKYFLDACRKSDNCKLMELDVSDNGLTVEGAKYLSYALKSDNCKLSKLDVAANYNLTAEAAKYLSDALKSDNCKLTKLDVGNNNLTAEGAKYLSDALKSDNCKLTELDVSGNGLTTEGAKYLSDALKSDNCKLTNLNVIGNDLKAEGVKYLSDALKSDNCKLTKLDVGHNGLTTEDAEYLSDALKSDNCKLTKLDVSGNGLTTEGAKYLSDALTNNNCKLVELDLSDMVNGLTTEGAKYLSDALKSDNCKLTKLNLRGSGLTTEGTKYLSDALTNNNCKLIELNVSGNGLTIEGAKYLSDALKSDNCKLAKLNVTCIDSTTEGSKYLSDALKGDNCKLAKLNVTRNGLTTEGYIFKRCSEEY